MVFEARCMKCREQKEIHRPEEVITKNGLRAIKGMCPDCGTKMCRIVGKA
jgi:Zn finger protein HypA/HybF involved in hydrogenase expression